MAISVSLTLDAGVILVGQPKRAAVLISNTEGFDIDIRGIDVNDALRSLTCGDLIGAVPVTYDILTSTTPIISQIPAYGTADQSRLTITGADLLYPYANFATTTSTITNDPGSYAGAQTPISSQYRIATGTSMVTFIDVISSGQNILETALPVTLTATVQATNSTTGAALQPAISAPVGTVISTKPVSGIRLAPINTTALIVKNSWSRPPEYSNFDVALQILLVFTDNTSIDVTGLLGHAFSSSGVAWTVSPSALYTSTAPGPIVGISNATPTFPVGSIPPGGWLGTKIVAGAGACTTNVSTDLIQSATITDVYLGLYTGTQILQHTNKIVVGIVTSPILSGLNGVGSNVDLLTRFVFNNGSFSDSLEGSANPPAYAIVGPNTGLASVNAVSGLVVQNIAGPSQITVKSTVSFNNGTGLRDYVVYSLISTS